VGISTALGLYAKQISCTAAILNLQTSKNPNFLEGHISNYFMHGFLRNLKISAVLFVLFIEFEKLLFIIGTASFVMVLHCGYQYCFLFNRSVHHVPFRIRGATCIYLALGFIIFKLSEKN
jgi:hypothetical protein